MNSAVSEDGRLEGRLGGGGEGVLVLIDFDGTDGRSFTLVDATTLDPFWIPSFPIEVVNFVERVGDVLFVSGSVSTSSDVATAEPGGWLWALDPVDGTERWRLALRDPFPNAPVLQSDGSYLVTASDPSISCD